MNKKLKEVATIISIIVGINAILYPILQLYIEYKINKALLPIQLELQEIKSNYKFWIKEISRKY